MEQLNATDQSSTLVDSEQLTATAASVMNLLAQMEWRAIILAVLASILVTLVDGHGRLFDPPSRSTAWRVGFDTPKDYNDNEGFCGGFDRQWLVNSGRCGVCGDPYDEMIKPHEAPGGLFATGTIVRNYTQGQMIAVTIQITATHRGFYEFKLCPNNNPKRDPTQDCFERYPLNFVDEMGATDPTFNLEKLSPATYQIRIQLPPEVTCSQCIIQWTYVTGNRWGVCPDGSSRLGCGPQESFRACADVTIVPFGSISPVITTVTSLPVATVLPATSSTTSPTAGSRPTTTQATTVPTAPPLVTTAVPSSSALPSLMTTTRRPLRPTRPLRPMRPTRPTRPPRPAIWSTTRRPGTVQISTTSPILGLFTRPPIQAIIRPPVFASSSTSTTTTTARPIPVAPVADAQCTNFVPVAAQNSFVGMTVWCNNNCRLGYCPENYCKCAQ